jgi:hypothetical protein
MWVKYDGSGRPVIGSKGWSLAFNPTYSGDYAELRVI